MTIMIYPYKAGSNSARDLAREMGVRRISHNNSRFRGSAHKTVINWGASTVPEEVGKCLIINRPEAVQRASDKLQFFRNTEARVPEWTTDPEEASQWWMEGHTIVERHILNGNSGAGIRLASHDLREAVERAPLYTKYVPKRHEYRIHVMNGQVLDVQRKARRREVPDEDVNWKIRNNDNGFVFARNEEGLADIPDDIIQQAISAVNGLGLDFGAADVIYNEREGRAYVLEVNTAPGLMGQTLTNYAAALEGPVYVRQN